MLGLPILRRSRLIPWGYINIAEEPNKYLEPIDEYFAALVEAKKYWNDSSYEELANWLGEQVGCYITNWGLQKLLETRCPDDRAALPRVERVKIYEDSLSYYDQKRREKNEVYETYLIQGSETEES